MKKVLLSVMVFALSATAAQAAPILYTATLSGANEIPTVPTTGTGSATIAYDPLTHLLDVNVVFAGLVSPTTASHIHCCTPQPGNAGVATTTPTFAGFPLGVTSGTFSTTLDLRLATSYNPAFVANVAGGSLSVAEALLTNGLATNMTYLNIHTVANPGGEIRGTIQAATVPEPASLALLGLGLAAAAGRRARRRS